MKKKLIAILLCGSMMFTLGGCTSKSIVNKNIQRVEVDENIIINSNLMSVLARLGANYEFVPLKYSGGVVKGIISPTKVDKNYYMTKGPVKDTTINPIIYREYNINALDKKNFVVESGVNLEINQLSLYREENANIKKIMSTNKGKTLDEALILEVNNEVYYFNKNGEIDKIIFNGEDIGLEEYFKLELDENETLELNYDYRSSYCNTIVGDNVFVKIETVDSKGVKSSLGDSVINIREKSMKEIPIAGGEDLYISKIFSKSDGLVILERYASSTTYVWIAKYEDGEFKKIVQLDKFSSNGTIVVERAIEDILYDAETKSFFIKRKINTDDKESYKYETLKLE